MEAKTISATMDFIKSFFEGDASGHDYLHSLRVWGMALHLAEKEKVDKVFEIQMAALLHDTDDHKIGGDGVSFPKAAQWLKEVYVSDASAKLILEIISEVSFKGAQTQTPVSTPQSAIVQDADRLDAMGAIGVARAFAYGGKHNRPLYLPNEAAVMHESFNDYKKSQSSTLAHFPEKLLLLKDRINTASAKQIAENRHQYLATFLQTFMDEASVYEKYIPVE